MAKPTTIIPSASMQDIARVYKGRWLESAFARTPQEEDRVTDYRRADPAWVNKENVQQDPRVKYAYVHRTIRQKHGHLLEAIENDASWRTPWSTSPDFAEAGEVVGKWLKHNLALPSHDLKTANDVVLDRGMHMGLKYGINWWQPYWDDDPDWWGVRYRNVAWEDVFTDWKAGRWYVVRKYVPLHELGEMLLGMVQIPVIDPFSGKEVPNSGEMIARNFQFLVEEVKKGTASMHRYNHWYAADRNRFQRDTGKVSDDDELGDPFYVDPELDPMSQRVPVLEYHQRRKHGLTLTVVPAYGDYGEDLLFGSAASPYGYNQLVPFIPIPIDEEEYGHSIPYVVGQLDEVASWALRAQLRFLARVADPAVLYRSGVKISSRNQEVLSRRSIEVENKDDVTFMDPPSSPQLHHLAMQITKSAMDDNVSESPARRGQTTGGTATENIDAQKNISVDDGLIARCGRQSLAQLMRVSIEILRVHVDKEKVIQVMGPEMAPEIIRLKPEFLNARFAISLTGSLMRTDPQIQAAAIGDAWQRFGPNFVDGGKAMHESLRLVGIDGSRFAANADAPKPKKPIDEHVAMLYGHTPQPSPKENLQQHLQEHLQFQQEVASAVPPEHPVHQILNDHIQATFSLQQYMMSQMPQAGAGTPALGAGVGATFGGPGNVGSPDGGRVAAMRSAGGNPATNPAVPAFAPGRQGVVA